MPSFYRKFDVELQIRDRLIGGIPKNKKIIKGWLQGKIDDAKAVKELGEKLEKDPDMPLDEKAESMWNGFRSNSSGLYVEERQIKAMLRESGTTLGLFKKHRGMKQIHQHGLFVKPEHITLEGGTFKTEERALRAMTKLGPRSALKRFDFVEQPALSFQLWIVESPKFSEASLRLMFELAQEGGLGADRSQGNGKFDVVKLEKVKS